MAIARAYANRQTRLLRAPPNSTLASAPLPTELPLYAREPLHFPYFQNSESFIRVQPCMLSRYRPQQTRRARSRLTPARRGQPLGRTRRDATTARFVRASRTFVLVRGIATRDFEELPCGKVGPCLELPLGGVSRAIRVVSARTGYIGTAWLIPHGDNARRPCTGDRDKY